MTPDPLGRPRLAPVILGSWLLACAVLCLVNVADIAALRFPDPDDAMRLMQARDWLGGQSWWDVGQHRFNGGHFPMHWSRLVDLPLALAMIVGDRIGATGVADRFAMTTVPLGTLLAVMAGVAHLTRRLAGRDEVPLALILTPLSIPLLAQLRPMRIDHHGWQVALAVAATVALVGPPTARRGALAGAALATLITVSLEGLPIAATIVGVIALSWVLAPERRHALRALLATFVGLAISLHVATRGPNALAASCDAISPVWLGALAIAAIGTGLATLVAWRSAAARLASLVPGAAAAAVFLLVAAPDCVRGPFASLPPLVRVLWYEQVTEGLPLWQQSPAWAIITIAVPVAGLVGTIVALRAQPIEGRHGWGLLLAILVPAVALSCLVNRAGATANALAMPGAAFLLNRMLIRARTVRAVLPRMLATAGAILAASPGVVAAMALPYEHGATQVGPGGGRQGRVPCERFDQVRALAQLPPGTVFAPVDVSPDLVATTRHHAISGGYHRNAAAMNSVLTAFTAPPAVAERIVRASGADYVAGCPGLNETRLYERVAPEGLWARLDRGEAVAWLEQVRLRGSPMLAWRVHPPAAAGKRQG